MDDQFEHHFECPACGATTSVLIDRSEEVHHRVEDCEVCCNPIEISYSVHGGKVGEFFAELAQ